MVANTKRLSYLQKKTLLFEISDGKYISMVY